MQSEIDRELVNLLEYIVRCIRGLGKVYGLKSYQIYPYLGRFRVIEYLLNNYEVLSTRPLNEVLNDLNNISKITEDELGDLKSSHNINSDSDSDEKREFELQVEGLMADVLLLLITEDGLTPLQAIDYLYTSRTCKALERPETCMYYESPVYVWDFLHSEKIPKT